MSSKRGTNSIWSNLSRRRGVIFAFLFICSIVPIFYSSIIIEMNIFADNTLMLDSPVNAELVSKKGGDNSAYANQEVAN